MPSEIITTAKSENKNGLRRNLTSVNLQSIIEPEKKEPSPSPYADDFDPRKDAPSKKSPSSELWRKALENSRKKRTTSLSSVEDTPPSPLSRRTVIVNENINLIENPKHRFSTTNLPIIITALAAMMGLVFYTLNNMPQESTKNILLNKFKIG